MCCVVSPLLPKIVALGIDSTDHLAGRRHSNGRKKEENIMLSWEKRQAFLATPFIYWGFIRS